jgi:hypothetical protein
MAAWNKLDRMDRRSIAEIILRDGSIETGGTWASTWLNTRAWELPAATVTGSRDTRAPRPGSREDRQERTANARRELREAAYRHDADAEDREVAAMRKNARSGPPMLVPYSDEWHAERARRVARSEPTHLMDDWAKRGMGWPC